MIQEFIWFWLSAHWHTPGKELVGEQLGVQEVGGYTHLGGFFSVLLSTNIGWSRIQGSIAHSDQEKVGVELYTTSSRRQHTWRNR
jgi:hypothetical protein